MGPAWLDRAEDRLGWLAVPNLPLFLAVMTGVVAVLSMAKPEFVEALALLPWALARGEYWRALTFLFVPPRMSPIWLALWLVVFYAFATRLERRWGDFRFTLYTLVGTAALVAGALISGQPVSNGLLQTSLFLAFARTHPDFEILLFFVIPAKMRYLFIGAWILWLVRLAGADGGGRIVLLFSVLNYALFFGHEHWRDLRYRLRR